MIYRFFLRRPLVAALALLLCACGKPIDVAPGDDGTLSLTVNEPQDFLVVAVEEAAAPKEVYLQLPGSRQLLGTVRLAESREDYRVAVPLPRTGGAVELHIAGAKMEDQFVATLETSAAYPAFEQTAQPGYRPARGWLGLPAAAVFDGTTYHIFYEQNPFGYEPGQNLHWGHATSTDLKAWHEQGPTFGGDSIGQPLGGSCVIDPLNTVGKGRQAMIAVYTASCEGAGPRRQEQCLAYGNDETAGHLVKLNTNPVLRTYDDLPDFRRPSIFRYQKGLLWMMCVASGNELRFYSADDMISWRLESRWGRDAFGEDVLFERGQLLPLDQTPTGPTRWLLLSSIVRHASTPEVKGELWAHVGTFNGHDFAAEGQGQLLDDQWRYFGAVAFDNVRDRILLVARQGNPFDADNVRNGSLLPAAELTVSPDAKPTIAIKPGTCLD